ncbi:hypothetical protein BC01_055 [Bacillus phage BC01]|nr:hypothetical protein PBC6_048 [Bacillus phage PBC6]AXU41152.1 hypothetical protein BC01_055 [Bacillus phage BC01]
MNAYQITIILTMTISGGIIGYLASRLQQEKQKVKLLEALKDEYKGQVLILEEARRVAGEVSYDTMIKKLNKDLAEDKITHEVYLEKIATVNRVYGRDGIQIKK